MGKVIKNLILLVCLFAAVAAFVLYLNQKRIVKNLQVQQTKFIEDLKRGAQAQKIAEGFKKKGLMDLEAQERYVMARIPQDEKDPVSVLKLLTQVAKETEISGVSIKSKPRQQTQVVSGENLCHFPLVLELDCGYQELCAFLNKILSMDRLMLIQELSVERKEELLPKLKVTLSLFAYTFSSTNHQPEGGKFPVAPPKPKLKPKPDFDFL